MVRDEWGGNRDKGKYEGENFRSDPRLFPSSIRKFSLHITLNEHRS